MEENKLNRLNDIIFESLDNKLMKLVLIDGFNIVGKYYNTHGNIPEMDFGYVDRTETLRLFMDDIIKKCEDVSQR